MAISVFSPKGRNYTLAGGKAREDVVWPQAEMAAFSHSLPSPLALCEALWATVSPTLSSGHCAYRHTLLLQRQPIDTPRPLATSWCRNAATLEVHIAQCSFYDENETSNTVVGVVDYSYLWAHLPKNEVSKTYRYLYIITRFNCFSTCHVHQLPTLGTGQGWVEGGGVGVVKLPCSNVI